MRPGSVRRLAVGALVAAVLVSLAGAVTPDGPNADVSQAAQQEVDNSPLVPVTSAMSARQGVTTAQLTAAPPLVHRDTSAQQRRSLAAALGLDVVDLAQTDELPGTGDTIVFISPRKLTPAVKLLTLDGRYALDGLDDVATVTMTGTTALTRDLMTALRRVGDPAYFSRHIGPLLASADLTHVSSEASFVSGCRYHRAALCSPPEFMETLVASGVDVVELTGNHNNDFGREANAATISRYHDQGWGTFGGGRTADEAAQPYVAEVNGTRVAFLGYNMADPTGSPALVTPKGAGANPYDRDRAKADIRRAHEHADIVIVTIQFTECFAYPNGYVEFPECDGPVPGQTAAFREVADLGADIVVGTAAHQPQTFELHHGTPIFYGLGNLYFDQKQWPGTERGLVLTHYLRDGQLLQTRVTPTAYNESLQPRALSEQQAESMLARLGRARPTAAPDADHAVQSALNGWLRGQQADFGVEVRNLDSGTVVASSSARQQFFTASIYKFYVAYLAYLRLQEGTWEDERRFSGSRTLTECLHEMIHSSDSPCGEAVLARIGAKNVTAELADRGLTRTSFPAFVTTPHDANTLASLLASGEELDDPWRARLLRSMRGHIHDDALIRGFTSAGVVVASKVGFHLDQNRHETAVVSYPDGRQFAVSVFSENQGRAAPLADLARVLDQALAGS